MTMKVDSESPLAHIYSFDMDTLKGFFSGHEDL